MRDWVRACVWAVLAVSMLLEDFTVAEEALEVTITVNYTRPPGSDLGTDEYRAASGPVTVTCNSKGADNVTYLWSSTCMRRNCMFDNNTKQEIFRAAVHSGDNGTHTCTVTMKSNETVVGNASINFNIVGAGIHVFRGNSTGDVGSLSNNGVIVSNNTDPQYRFRFACRSDSMTANVGTLIGLDGTNVTTSDVFDITNPQPGELLVESRPMNQSDLTASDQGVYTCRIPLQNGTIKNINIGIYPSGFNTPPNITSVTREPMSSNVTCNSTGSPATTVTWMRNGKPLTIEGSLYQLTQTVTDRKLSTYENVLTIPDSDSDGCSYTCTVTNALGNDSQTDFPPPRTTISPPETPTAGQSFSLTCTVFLTVGDSLSVQWTGPNGATNSNSIKQSSTMTDDCNVTSISTLELSPVRTSHAGIYECRAHSTGWTSLDTKTLNVQIPPPTLSMSREPDATVTLHHRDPLILTCTIQLDPEVVDRDVEVIGNLRGPGEKSTTMPMMDSAGVYRITLNIPSLLATLSDTYTCTATVMPGSEVVNVTGSNESRSSLDISVELAVNITVSYEPPPGAELAPNEYRAASGPVNVTCTAVGGTGPVSYQWSSTCRDCPFQTANSSSVTRAAVHSGDTGVHTCTATSGSIRGSGTISFNVVGAGIYVFRGASTGDSQVPGSLPNNGIVISLIRAEIEFYFRFFCRSDSMMNSVGMLIGPDGTTVTTGDIFTIARPQPGELTVENKLSQNVLTANDQGVYTCRIPLQGGEMKDINVGIYPSGFSTPPSITHLGFTYGSISSTLTCISTGSPATNVTWMRDGQPLTLSGSTYQMTQTVANRRLSTYENILIINRATSNIIGNTYNCTVVNALSKDSRTLRAYPPPTVTISPPEMPTAGEPFSFTCNVTLADGDSLIGDPTVQWIGPDGVSINSDIQQVMANDSTVTYTSTLEFTPVQTSHGGQYTCQATSTSGTNMDAKTLTVQIPPPTLAMSRVPDATVTLHHGDNLTLTCTIQLDTEVANSNVVVTGNLGGPGGSSTMPVMDSAGVYRISLDIPSLLATLSDTYTCNATVMPGPGVVNVLGSESHSSVNITVELAVSVTVSYIPPPGAELGPNQYRAGSGPVTVTCMATDPVSYQWSSTCRNCPFQTATSNSVTRAAVHSGDTGIHTCTATSGSISESETISFNVVGAGIHVFRGASTGDLQVPGSLPNNGIVVSLNTAEDGAYFRFFCRSDSMMSNVGMLIGPNETAVNTSDVFTIARPQRGELTVENKLSQNVLTASDQGVYTCRIPLQSGVLRQIEMRDINVGIYPSGFNTPPSITHLGFSYGSISSTLTCFSTGSPATNVIWMRDGQPLTLSGSTYQLTQTVANRKLSNYENVLIIKRATPDIIGNTYNCTVVNALGKVSRTLTAYPPPTVTISLTEIPILGESFSLTCTVTLAEGDSLIGDPTVQWIGPDGVPVTSNIQQVMANSPTYLSTVEFTPVQTSHGGQYICQATSTSGTIMDAKILTVQNSSSSSIPAGAVGGAIAGVLIVVLIVVIIVAALCIMKQHGKLRLRPQPKWPITGASLELTDTGKDQVKEIRSSVQSKSEGISVALFSAHVSTMHADKDRGFQSEFESLRKGLFASHDVALTPCNKERNRFLNIYPYDFCRVKLKEIEGVEGSDYINASFIEGYTRQNEYIASQAPVPGTVGDFWRMIWEHKLTTIAMLTRCTEEGKKKCEQYWPKTVNGTEEVGYNLTVTLTSLLPFAEYEIRTLIVKDAFNHKDPALEVTHFFYQAWPDHGVPLNAISLISFIQVVRKSHPPSHPQPLLVHCSAGVGRTGTFIVIDMEMQRIKDMGVVNVFGCLEKLRRQRVQMVQTLVQYKFTHNALDDLITCGKTDISAVNLRVITSQLHQTASGKQVSGFQEQYELLEQVSPNLETASFSDATAKCNLSKNRYTSKVAGNYYRVFLRQTGVEGSDYINANFVDGYRKRGAYIATQGPLASTVKNFWRMIWEYQSKCIVMLCSFLEEGEALHARAPKTKESCYPYWPMDQGLTTKYGEIGVTLKSEEKYHAYVVRKFEVFEGKSKSAAENRGPSPFTVTQFQLLCWPKHGQPSSPVLLEVMENVNRVQMTTGNKAITVMCNDGMGRTGAFICLHAQIERLKTEGVIDCFQFIKSARLNRPGLVQSVEQYILCHEVLKEFVGSFETYSNFQEVI